MPLVAAARQTVFPRSTVIFFAILAGLVFSPLLSADDTPHRPIWFLPLNAAVQKSLLPLMSQASIDALSKEGEIHTFANEKVPVALCPRSDLSQRILKASTDVGPTVSLECLLIYPMGTKLANSPTRDLELYNALHRFHSMEGLEYFSQSRNQMRVFFTKSRVVKSQDDRTTVPDPVYTTLETEHKLFLQQEDSSFGDNLYEVTVSSVGKGGILLSIKNAQQMWYGIAPVLGPHAMVMQVLIQPLDNGNVLFYGNAGINAARVFGLDEKAKLSFYNRIIALYNWYASLL